MTDPSKVLPPPVIEALRAGNKIEAIKRLREVSGIGLGEAKALIDAVEHHARAAAKQGKQAASAAATMHAKHTGHPHAKHPNPLIMHRPGLSPGEEPRVGGHGWWILALIAAGVFVYFMATGSLA